MLDVGRLLAIYRSWALDVWMLTANAQRPTPKVFASKALNAQRSMYPRARSFRCSLAMNMPRSIWLLHSKPKDSSSRRFVIRRWQKAQRVCALRLPLYIKRIKSARSAKRLEETELPAEQVGRVTAWPARRAEVDRRRERESNGCAPQ